MRKQKFGERVLQAAAITLTVLVAPAIVRADDTIGVQQDSPGLGTTPTSSAITDTSHQLAQVDISTGAATSSLEFALPRARGRAQPSLGLHYNSRAGVREAGVGWGLTLPTIERKPLWGAPTYSETAGLPNLSALDRFEFSGQPLVPICIIVHGDPCAGDGSESLPWADGWIYFRLQTEGSFSRFYHSPDFETWEVFNKDGTALELGCARTIDVTVSNFPQCNAVDVDRNVSAPNPTGNAIYRWNVAAAYHLEGGVNVVAFLWQHPSGNTNLVNANIGTLTDVYYSPPPTGAPAGGDFSSYGYHVQLQYAAPPFADVSYAPIWKAVPYPLLQNVTVYGPDQTPIRSYSLAYTQGRDT